MSQMFGIIVEASTLTGKPVSPEHLEAALKNLFWQGRGLVTHSTGTTLRVQTVTAIESQDLGLIGIDVVELKRLANGQYRETPWSSYNKP